MSGSNTSAVRGTPKLVDGRYRSVACKQGCLPLADGNIRKLSFETNRINLQQKPTMTVIVDAHQHFWNYGTYQTSWMEKPPYAGDPTFASIRRSFGPDDLQPELKAASMSASITVQAADGPKENDILLKHAALTPWVAGVVGWVPLDKPDEVGRMLEQFSRERKFVGVRHLINVEPDPDWIMRSAVIEGLSVLMDYNLTFDYVGASSSITWANPQLPVAHLSLGRRY